VFHHSSIDVVKELASRLVAGGLSVLEFTNRGAGAVEVFGELVEWGRAELPELTIGAGSIVDPATAGHLIDLGTSFVVGPALSAEVAVTCNARNVPYVPGCGTLTEILQAYRLGADVVKLFPAGQIGGPAFLEAVRGPCPWVRAMPTGGVEPTVESLSAWYRAGAPAVGIGGKLIPKTLIESEDWDGIQEHVAQCVSAVASARRES
jgi:2-dehydro-3-deoxyphosphogluconate aldolase/(4S)-4-hydroxy-2-oxoglutarate aldolase